MNWKLCQKIILIASMFLASAEIWAQDQHNITCINQFYHNWADGVGDVAVQGDRAYLACLGDGFRIVDIADCDAPYDVGHLPMDRADALAVAGNYAYVGGWNSGVRVIDISNPASPQEVHNIPVEGGVNAIRIYGDYAFVCSRGEGLTFVDISNPTAAQVVWNSPDIYRASDIEIHGTVAYAACNYDGLLVIDISQITSPQVTDTHRTTGGEWVTGCSISDGYAYLSCGWNGLCVVDLSTMQMVASIDSLSYAFGVKVKDGYAYVHYGDPDCPIAVVDISNPLSPQTLGVYYPPQDALNFTMKGNMMYVADDHHGLRIVDISDPRNPYELAYYSRYGQDLDVTISGDYAYVREDLKLKIIDIANLQHPSELGYYEMDWEYCDLDIVGNVAYLLTHGYTCLYAVDLTNPHSPSLLGTFTVTTNNDIHYRMAVYEHYAYIVENDGLRILDITNPSNMMEVGYYDYHFGNATIEIFDHYAFVVGYRTEISVLDLANPISPTQIASCDFDGYCTGMKASDGTLYILSTRKLWVFELPVSPQWAPLAVINLYDELGHQLYGIDVHGHYIYVSVEGYGLCVYDVAERSAPQLTGYFETPGYPRGVAAMGDIAVFADFTNLGFYDCSQALFGEETTKSITPQTAALLQNYPNPFNASTQIPLELPSRSHVTLKVFDVLGRQVSTLADCEFTAGRHVFHWNGTGTNGQPLASGKYFIRASIADQLETMPILYLK